MLRGTFQRTTREEQLYEENDPCGRPAGGHGAYDPSQRVTLRCSDAVGTGNCRGRLRRQFSPTEPTVHVDITMAPNFVIDTGSALRHSRCRCLERVALYVRRSITSIPMVLGRFSRWTCSRRNRIGGCCRQFQQPGSEPSPMRLLALAATGCIAACCGQQPLLQHQQLPGLSATATGLYDPPPASGADFRSVQPWISFDLVTILYGRWLNRSSRLGTAPSNAVLGGARPDRRCWHPGLDRSVLRHVRAQLAAASQESWLGVTRWPATASPWRSLMPRSHAGVGSESPENLTS